MKLILLGKGYSWGRCPAKFKPCIVITLLAAPVFRVVPFCTWPTFWRSNSTRG